MFIKNKFYNEYYNIINEACKLNRVKLPKNNPNYVYYESHHIIPRSLNGSNVPNNLVLLTPQEHYRCHELLPMFTKGNDRTKMIYAWNLMSRIKDKVIDKEIYAKLKIEHSNNISNDKERSRKISESNKNKILSYEHKKKLSNARKLITGWNHTTETKLKMSKNHWLKGTKGKTQHSEESKIKMSKTRKKLKWYNNGQKNIRINPEIKIPKGYKPGRINQKSTTKNYTKWTNGTKNITLKKGLSPPEGYYRGITILNSYKPIKSYKHKIIKCPFCGTEGDGGNMTRYHFNNCKYK